MQRRHGFPVRNGIGVMAVQVAQSHLQKLREAQAMRYALNALSK